MIPVTRFAGKTVLVLGLARSGRAAARALAEGGARVLGADDGVAACAAAQAEGIDLIDPGEALPEDVAAVVASPGVPFSHPAPHPLIRAARERDVPVVGDIALFRTACPDVPLIGVTGTNGKSTTTALIGHLLQAAGRPTRIAGNIGRPILAEEAPEPDTTVVLELSSYQLDLTLGLSCRVAVWLNLTPDHLDRHGDMDGYAAAKRRIFRGQTAGDWAVIGVDDPWGQAEAERLRATNAGPRVVPVSVDDPQPGGVAVIGGLILDGLSGIPDGVGAVPDISSLRGRHNAQNLGAAYAALRALGVPAGRILEGLAGFEGLPHRMEPVGTIDGIACINDSKATNPDAAATSLGCFDDILWIAGGKAKPGGFDAIEPVLPRIRRAFLIGEAEDAIARFLEGRVGVERSGTLERALDHALAFAGGGRDGDASVILLAPACASFDQFADFEARGDCFRRLVGERAASPSRKVSGS
ncbi:UDP-N-acetylmuramoyl-L-alanine--D-glutamate ligase [Marinivivus vitaminiproducens]|uniref:UDP-N-acetylmuramoyl-L-alanine--D-glutamate ligase n=1 Tax=Marinivivus vitaminiproducens TaxID=3035935 RepID=UPI0027A43AFE|nr:UDP-N-acetylmuramoyl-L-alanine--D-glutamate ligase [Geminicoccaceae bacterium SCSIO 64248]